MRVHPLIAGALVTAMLSLQAWTLLKLSALSEDVAALKVQVAFLLKPQMKGEISWQTQQSGLR